MKGDHHNYNIIVNNNNEGFDGGTKIAGVEDGDRHGNRHDLSRDQHGNRNWLEPT